MDFIGDTSGILGLIKLFFLGGFMGVVFGAFLKFSQFKEKRKQQKKKK